MSSASNGGDVSGTPSILRAIARWFRPADPQGCICLPYDVGMGFVRKDCPRYADHLHGWPFR